MFAPGKLNRQKVLFEYILSSEFPVETHSTVYAGDDRGIILQLK